MGFLSERHRGIIGTLLFHAGIFALLYFLGFSTPLPLPEEEGIMVNFGDNRQGNGALEPGQSRAKKRKTLDKTEKPKVQHTPKQNKRSTSESKEQILTQNHEEAPSLPSSKILAEKKEKEKKQKARLKREKQEAEKRAQEKLLRQQKEAEERKLLAELERKRKEEEEKQRKIEAINQKAKNIFGKGSTNSNSQSQGKSLPGGNQGAKTGSVNSDNYYGTGLGSKGISYSLSGRTSRQIPKPQYDYQEGGKVVVEITVDRNGKVVRARAGMPGSTTSNSQLYVVAQKAALKAIFNSAPNAPAYQKGSITYNFLLD